jgi:hypothetical protein
MAVMTYSFARIGAVVAMRVEDYYPGGKRWWVRLHEKGGKRHEMPAHHKLEGLGPVPLKHQVSGAPDVDLGYRAGKIARSRSPNV